MILVDTNILIDFFNSPTNEMRQFFINEDVAICGVVQAELLHGTKTQDEISETLNMFSGLNYISFVESDWISLGFLLQRLRKEGVTVPLADAIIAYLGIKNNCKIWTQDKHFSLIKEKVPELMLFDF